MKNVMSERPRPTAKSTLKGISYGLIIVDDLSPIGYFEYDRKTKGRKLNKTKRGNAQKRNWEAL